MDAVLARIRTHKWIHCFMWQSSADSPARSVQGEPSCLQAEGTACSPPGAATRSQNRGWLCILSQLRRSSVETGLLTGEPRGGTTHEPIGGPTDKPTGWPTGGTTSDTRSGTTQGPIDGLTGGPTGGINSGPTDGLTGGLTSGLMGGTTSGPTDGLTDGPTSGPKHINRSLLSNY